MVDCHVRFIYKPNAFLMILEPILRFWLQNHQNSTGFIRYFDQLFRMLQNALGPIRFWSFAKSSNAINFYWKHNAFDTFGGQFVKMSPKVSLNDRFYKVFWSTFFYASNHSRTNAFLLFCKVVKRHPLLLKDLMIFWDFMVSFCQNGPKSLLKRQVL